MFRIAVIALFAGTVGALLGGGLTDRFLRDDVAMVAANGAPSDAAPIAWQAGSMTQATLRPGRHFAMLGTRKVSHRVNSELRDPLGTDDGLFDDITVAPRSHKMMISALHVSARMAVSGG